ncbi:MAG: serine/threonine-protein kinase [Rhodanobacter sp.]|jgi:serine/threonine-protein kinase|nr:serine/threonine-protein kinase [Rhodanobacter sp.]
MTAHDQSAEHYHRAHRIAHEALDFRGDARTQHIARTCTGDEELRREVEWLIESAERDESPGKLEDIGVFAQTLLADARIESAAPRRYHLRERLGEGGMGQVWLAEYDSGGVRQRIALKLLRQIGVPNPVELTRFHAEGRILASLDHPNIAHLVDAGANADGVPYLAMEYIEGERIDRWCATHALSLRARMECFLKVCAAVEYAHAHLTIHRDLKPANILVNATGEPKLLDFGIARLLDTGAGTDATRTATALRAMTPAYASPEQIEGAPLGTATDIYSLGVVLYELLSGVRPFDHLDTDRARANAIVTGEIIPPSRRARTVTQAPIRRIPRDLDAIVLKALRHKPEQRYASVGALATDLRRHLVALPVQARRGQWSYRVRRFAWRNRWAMGACVLLFALGMAFLIDREAQLRRIETERDRAALERDRAQAVANFTAGLFDYAGALAGRGSTVSVREMLDRGAEELQKREDLSAPIKGELLLTMGQAYNSLKLGQSALPLLQAAQPLLASADPLERAHVLDAIGQAQYKNINLPQAIAAHTAALALLRSAPGDHTQEIADQRTRIAYLHSLIQDVPLTQSIAELTSIVTELENAAHPAEKTLLDAYNSLAIAYDNVNDNTHALPFADRAVELATHLYGATDQRTLTARTVQAQLVIDIDPSRAAALYDELIASYDRFNSTPTINRGILSYNHGRALRFSGQYAQAASELEKALALARELGGARHPLTLAAANELGVTYNLSGQPDKTKTLLDAALEDFAAAAHAGGDSERDRHAWALATLGEAQRMNYHYARAAVYLAQAEAIYAAIDNTDGVKDDVLDLLEWTTRLHIDQHHTDAARTTLERHDTLMRTQSPLRAWRQAASRELHESLAKIPDQPAAPHQN